MNAKRWPYRGTSWNYWSVIVLWALAVLPGAGLILPNHARAAQDLASSGGPATRPSVVPAVLPQIEHRVRIVVDSDVVSFQGEAATAQQLPALLASVRDRKNTVLELAYASDQVTMARFNEVTREILEDRLRDQLGFKYVSFIGQQAMDSRGSQDRVILPPGYSLPPLVPHAPVSELTHAVKFEIGLTDMPAGSRDRITITEIKGTSDHFELGGTFVVRGTYHLESADEASLALSIAARKPEDGLGRWGHDQSVNVKRGDGTFELIERIPCEGFLHVSFYSDIKSLGGVYFGTGDWLLKYR